MGLGRQSRAKRGSEGRMIQGITNDGAMPVLDAMVRYAGARQRLIAHNAANISTPDFRPLDVDPAEFRSVLRRAVEERRSRHGAIGGELELRGNERVRFGSSGSIELNPRTPTGNVLFHDRNNRDVERLMQANAENLAAFRVATDLLRSRMEIMRIAISERV